MYRHIFFFLLAKCLVVEWMEHIVKFLCLFFFKEATKLFSEVALSFRFPLVLYKNSSSSISSPTLGLGQV